MISLSPKAVQSVIAYVAIVMGILTTGPVSGITLPHLASALLGGFGILLHPHTSVTSPPASATPVVPPVA